MASRLSCDDFKDEEMANTAPPSARGEEVVDQASLLKKRDALPGNTQVDGHHLNRVKKIVLRVGLAYSSECCSSSRSDGRSMWLG